MDYIIVKTQKYISKVYIDDIMYIIREGRKLRLVCCCETHSYYETMDRIKPCLDRRFYFPLQGLCVNFDYVCKIGGCRIVFENGDVITVGSDCIGPIKRDFHHYLRREQKRRY